MNSSRPLRFLSRIRRGITGLALPALLACITTACVSVDGPEQDELDSVRAGKDTIALFRVVITSNAGALPPFSETLESQCMSVGLSDPDAEGAVAQIDSLESFSDETLEQGWLYFVLPPGKHSVAVNPPGMYDPRGDERWSEAAHWAFVIPKDTPVVYLGSLRVHCRAEASDFGGVRIRDIRAQKMRDESSAATAIAAKHLPDLPAPVTVLPKRLFRRESTLLRSQTN